ncbi:hypothetical protein [Corynebacterium sp. AOP12-C2-36]|uniref:hypothetical protein n=1 Tax=Corynebacterium sp. AOP12-C2-36 TaxID=3457723 RepID=UPI0040340FDA
MLPTAYDPTSYLNAAQAEVGVALAEVGAVGGDSGHPDRGLMLVPARLHNRGDDRVITATHGPGAYAAARRGIAAGQSRTGASVAISPAGAATLLFPGMAELILHHPWSDLTMEAWLHHGPTAAAELVDADLSAQATTRRQAEALPHGWAPLGEADLAGLAGVMVRVTRTPAQGDTETREHLDVEVIPDRAIGTCGAVAVSALRITHGLTDTGWSIDYQVAALADDGEVLTRLQARNPLLGTGHHFHPLWQGPEALGLATSSAETLRAVARIYRAALNAVADPGHHRPTGARSAPGAGAGNSGWSLSDISGLLASAGSGVDTQTLTISKSGVVDITSG